VELSLLRPLPNDVGWISQWFGETTIDYSRFGLTGHNGVDYAAPKGSPVLAAHAGKCETGYDEYGYGNYVRISTAEYKTVYGHLERLLVSDGQEVVAGQAIALVGSTGNSTGPHLHFGLKFCSGHNPGYLDWVDPVPFRDV
jgi:murein DD-endopeptidase MepM/ murein hydrolase activator NlpD